MYNILCMHDVMVRHSIIIPNNHFNRVSVYFYRQLDHNEISCVAPEALLPLRDMEIL